MVTPKVKKSTIAINWIEKNLQIPDGRKFGQPIKLMEFQKKFIRDVYDNPHKTRLAILSLGRKNGKTLLIAVLLALHLFGPFAHPNSQVYSMAMIKDQAAETFRYIHAMLKLNPAFDGFYKARESSKFIVFPRIGTTFQALSADVTGAKTQGKSPIVFVADEIGQTVGPKNPLFDAMMTGQGAHDNPLGFMISTQASQASDLLSLYVDEALANTDPQVICHLYTCPEDVDAFSEEALYAANPALAEGNHNLGDLKFQQAKAKRLPSDENDFRNKVLNQRIEKVEPFIARAIWDENKQVPESYLGKKVWLGLDLSETRDLTACCIVHENDDGQSYSINMKYWLPEYNIAEKERLDKVPYQAWEKAGLISLTPGRAVDYNFVAAELAKLHEECDIQAVSYDRWNLKHFTKAMLEQGIPETWIESTFKPFGQGFQSMSPAIRELESLILNGNFHHGEHPILAWNFRSIKVVRDPANNRKFEKLGKNRRIDGAIASVMAIAAAIEGGSATKFVSYLETEEPIFF